MSNLFQGAQQDSAEPNCPYCGKSKFPPSPFLKYFPHSWKCDCAEWQEATEKREAIWAEQERQQEQKRQAEVRALLLKKSRLPSRYHNARIETATRPPEIVRNYVKHPTGGLYIAGPVGTGKTHMAACIVNSFIDRAEPVIFGGVISLLGMIQATFNGQGDEAEVLNRLSTVPLLVIDDLGKEKVSEWVEQTLFRVIDNRYNEDKRLIVTSNWTPDVLEKRYPTAGQALISRLAEMCLYAEMGGKDMRKQ